MATRLIFYPYNLGSASTRDLTTRLREEGIRTLRVRPNGIYRPFRSHVKVNWGNSTAPQWDLTGEDMLNKTSAVAVAANKLKTFEALQEAGLSIPEWTTDKDTATQWTLDGNTVFARTKLTGHSGDGIVVLREDDDIVDAPLYTKYKKKKNEYRVHVFNGTVLSVQEKRRERDVDRTEDQSLIRSHDNGWVFCREDVVYTDALTNLAKDAIVALGLDFGAVDIIYNQKEDKHYVLEVNTAPGLTGQTLDEYVEAFKNFYNNQ